jgi:hypothetical protein
MDVDVAQPSFLFVITGVRYKRVFYNPVNLCNKMTNLTSKSVHYSRLFISNRVHYNQVSLYNKKWYLICLLYNCVHCFHFLLIKELVTKGIELKYYHVL